MVVLHLVLIVLLNLDVARLLDVLLDEHTVIAESSLSLLLGQMESSKSLLVVPGNTHTLTTTSSRGLDHHRVTNIVGDLQHLLVGVDLAVETGNGVHLSLHSQLLGANLISHSLNGVLARSAPADSLLLKSLGESPVLRKETVTRVDGISTGLTASLDDLISNEVGLSGRRGTNVNSFIGHLHVLGVAIGIGVDSNGLDTHALSGLEDTAGNFTTVGYQDLLEGQFS